MAVLADVITRVRRRVLDPATPVRPIARKGVSLIFSLSEPHSATLPFLPLKDKSASKLYTTDGTVIPVASWSFYSTQQLQLVHAAYDAGVSWYFDFLSLSPMYADADYTAAINFAFSKLVFDFQWPTTPTLLTLDAKYDFLLDKLATIEMARLRAGEDTTNPTGQDDFQKFETRDLRLERFDRGYSGAGYWLAVIKELQAEYDGERASISTSVATCAIVPRISRRGSQMRKQSIWAGPPAPTVTATYADEVLTVGWTRWLHDAFYQYVIYVDAVQVASYSDSQTQTGDIDIVLAAGTHTITVDIVSNNAIKNTGTTTVTVT